MKRSQELELMLKAYQAARIPITTELKAATAAGLRSIRAEKYNEHVRAEQKRKDAHYRPGMAESGRERITTENGLAMLRSGDGRPRVVTAGSNTGSGGNHGIVTTADGTPV